jgi:hypothetical protein
MLAGGSHNINSGNRWIFNNLAMMDEKDREQAMRYMLPGGQLQAAVDARNAESAAAMAQRAITGFLTNNPMNSEEEKRLNEQKLRAADPAAAGAQDIAAGRYETPEAIKELDRLAAAHDTSWGGFSYENEAALAQTLQRPPYNMSQAEAEATAYRYAEKKRWFTGGQPGGPATGEAPESGTDSGQMPQMSL